MNKLPQEVINIRKKLAEIELKQLNLIDYETTNGVFLSHNGTLSKLLDSYLHYVLYNKFYKTVQHNLSRKLKEDWERK